MRFREQAHLSVEPFPPVARMSSGASEPPTVATQPTGIWRLLAPNNRELGRSSFVYGSFQAARGHVLQLRESRDSLTAITIAGPFGENYGWVVTLGDATVMTCSRWVTTASAALAAAAGAIGAFTSADIAELPLRTTSSGRRTSRSPSHSLNEAAW